MCQSNDLWPQLWPWQFILDYNCLQVSVSWVRSMCPAASLSCGICTPIYYVSSKLPGEFNSDFWGLFHKVFICSLLKILFAQILILLIRSSHNFAHVMTAQLSWYVQNYDLIGSLYYAKTTFFFTRFGLWAHKPFVKWVLGLRAWLHRTTASPGFN